jgi:hypothetical protein
MYELALSMHSWLRWGVLLAGFAATASAVAIRPGLGATDRADRRGLIFMIGLDLQMLLGLLLYLGLSPTTTALFGNFGEAMRDPVARFWAVEHVAMMFVAVILAHLGRILARKTASIGGKRIRLSVCFALALVAIIVATPWPGMVAGRPWFRF